MHACSNQQLHNTLIAPLSAAHIVMCYTLRITISLMKSSNEEMRGCVRLHNDAETILGRHATLKSSQQKPHRSKVELNSSEYIVLHHVNNTCIIAEYFSIHRSTDLLCCSLFKPNECSININITDSWDQSDERPTGMLLWFILLSDFQAHESWNASMRVRMTRPAYMPDRHWNMSKDIQVYFPVWPRNT